MLMAVGCHAARDRRGSAGEPLRHLLPPDGGAGKPGDRNEGGRGLRKLSEVDERGSFSHDIQGT